jgi:enoyl-[acyl-carrier-protein] reductase (NADH)
MHATECTPQGTGQSLERSHDRECPLLTGLKGKRGLVVGIANGSSIAAGCAQAFVAGGATIAATDLNDKALPDVRAVTDAIGCELLMPCDVTVPGQLESVFERIRLESGRLNALLLAIAFRPPMICTAVWSTTALPDSLWR